MPFIESKVSVTLSAEKETILKEKLGKAIECIPGKSEGWLMLNFEDNAHLYFKGSNEEPTAFIEVKIYGKASKANYDKLTEEICDIYHSVLDIPSHRIYVKYEEIEYWGWNGRNF